MIRHLLQLNIHSMMQFGGSNEVLYELAKVVDLKYRIIKPDVVNLCALSDGDSNMELATVEATLIRMEPDKDHDICVVLKATNENPTELKDELIRNGWVE